jgi:peptide/nickel transport system permease protein
MVMFVWTAIFADLICRFDPLRPIPRTRWRRPMRALAGRRFIRPRRLEPHRLRRAHLARGRHRLDRARLLDRRHRRALPRLSRRLGRSGVPARHRHLQALPLLVLALVMTAALGPSLPNTIIAIAIPLMPTSPASSAPTRWRCANCRSSRPRARSA